MTPNMQDDQETGIVILCAIRYCIGRQTYMPTLVTNWIKRNWSHLEPKDKALILRDVQEACDRDYLGDNFDRDTWFSFRDWMIAKEGDRP